MKHCKVIIVNKIKSNKLNETTEYNSEAIS